MTEFLRPKEPYIQIIERLSSKERKSWEIPLFCVGDFVNVYGNLGDIETGWVINGFVGETISVAKNLDGKETKKEISRTKLLELNPQCPGINLKDIKDWETLSNLIQALGGLVGPKRFYNVTELEKMINGVKNKTLPLAVIPIPNLCACLFELRGQI